MSLSMARTRAPPYQAGPGLHRRGPAGCGCRLFGNCALPIRRPQTTLVCLTSRLQMVHSAPLHPSNPPIGHLNIRRPHLLRRHREFLQLILSGFGTALLAVVTLTSIHNSISFSVESLLRCLKSNRFSSLRYSVIMVVIIYLK